MTAIRTASAAAILACLGGTTLAQTTFNAYGHTQAQCSASSSTPVEVDCLVYHGCVPAPHQCGDGWGRAARGLWQIDCEMVVPSWGNNCGSLWLVNPGASSGGSFNVSGPFGWTVITLKADVTVAWPDVVEGIGPPSPAGFATGVRIGNSSDISLSPGTHRVTYTYPPYLIPTNINYVMALSGYTYQNDWSLAGQGQGIHTTGVRATLRFATGEATFDTPPGVFVNCPDLNIVDNYWRGNPVAPEITTQPATQTVATAETATLLVEHEYIWNPSYQWRKDGVALVDSPGFYDGIAGSTTPTLTIQGAVARSAGDYDCVVTSDYGSTTTNPATLTVTPGCGSADYDGDGDIGTDADIQSFFACLAGNCAPGSFGADFDGDGDIGPDADIEAFFRVLAGGNC
jgi:hypothetical protein